MKVTEPVVWSACVVASFTVAVMVTLVDCRVGFWDEVTVVVEAGLPLVVMLRHQPPEKLLAVPKPCDPVMG